MKKTLALFGSARRHGNTGQLMDLVAYRLGIEVIDLAEKDIAPYTYEHLNRHDDFEPLVDYVLKFENIVFASPVYWDAVSVPMKVFLDRLSDLLDIPELRDKWRRLRGKTAYVVCTSIHERVSTPFITSFKHTFRYLGMHYGGHLHVNCRDGFNPEAQERKVQRFVKQIEIGRSGVGPSQPLDNK